ncbi:hypothetical protein GCM10010873_22530 [Cypionkella aquatica]|uniref:Uncharacterized protein n=1 Tax=Cypionkella aquatica TaxID=1756042 RepID=A0AA37U3Z4_9RHOB|nr:hypothetical protein [Cypionkella aquatica]GLS87279.1 hypothetical protein GCM10010873_22530 [Cypionkella aquatica]
MRLVLAAMIGLALTPQLAAAEGYAGLIIPAEHKGIKYKVELTADDKAGPYDVRVWRIDGGSMSYERKVGVQLLKVACAAEDYAVANTRSKLDKGQLVFKGGCK